MAWWISRATAFLANTDNVVNLFLVGAFAAVGARSVAQQGEIDALEAEKESLRSSNRAMQKSMWEWRQALSNLHDSNPASFPVSMAKLRTIYGEEDPQAEEASGAVFSIPPIPYMQAQPQGSVGEDGTAPPASATFAI